LCGKSQPGFLAAAAAAVAQQRSQQHRTGTSNGGSNEPAVAGGHAVALGRLRGVSVSTYVSSTTTAGGLSAIVAREGVLWWHAGTRPENRRCR